MALLKLNDTSALQQFLSNHKNVLMIFVAKWCKICNNLKPTLEALAKNCPAESCHDVKFGVVYESDIGEDIHKYDIIAFPTFVLFENNGNETERVQGVFMDNVDAMIAGVGKTPARSSGGAAVSPAEAREAPLQAPPAAFISHPHDATDHQQTARVDTIRHGTIDNHDQQETRMIDTKKNSASASPLASRSVETQNSDPSPNNDLGSIETQPSMETHTSDSSPNNDTGSTETQSSELAPSQADTPTVYMGCRVEDPQSRVVGPMESLLAQDLARLSSEARKTLTCAEAVLLLKGLKEVNCGNCGKRYINSSTLKYLLVNGSIYEVSLSFGKPRVKYFFDIRIKDEEVLFQTAERSVSSAFLREQFTRYAMLVLEKKNAEETVGEPTRRWLTPWLGMTKANWSGRVLPNWRPHPEMKGAIQFQTDVADSTVWTHTIYSDELEQLVNSDGGELEAIQQQIAKEILVHEDQRRHNGQNAFTRLRAGASSTSADEECEFYLSDDGTRQEISHPQEMGDCGCVPSALLSYLSMKCPNQADKIDLLATKMKVLALEVRNAKIKANEKDIPGYEGMCLHAIRDSQLCDGVSQLPMRLMTWRLPRDNIKGQYCPFQDREDRYKKHPVAGILVNSLHFVIIHDDWIIDPAARWMLKLTRENLDISVGGGPGSYRGFSKTWELLPAAEMLLLKQAKHLLSKHLLSKEEKYLLSKKRKHL